MGSFLRCSSPPESVYRGVVEDWTLELVRAQLDQWPSPTMSVCDLDIQLGVKTVDFVSINLKIDKVDTRAALEGL